MNEDRIPLWAWLLVPFAILWVLFVVIPFCNPLTGEWRR